MIFGNQKIEKIIKKKYKNTWNAKPLAENLLQNLGMNLGTWYIDV